MRTFGLIALGAFAAGAAVVLDLGSTPGRDTAPAVAPPAVRGVPVAPDSGREDDLAPIGGFPTLEANDPAQVREVVGFCRAAVGDDRPALRDAALRSPDPLVVGNALGALGRLGALLGDPELLALLDDPRPRVRQEAIRALGAWDDSRAVPLLTRTLAAEDDATLRLLSIQALGALTSPDARYALENHLPRDEAESVFLRTALEGTGEVVDRR